jgi:hypothetical protein
MTNSLPTAYKAPTPILASLLFSPLNKHHKDAYNYLTRVRNRVSKLYNLASPRHVNFTVWLLQPRELLQKGGTMSQKWLEQVKAHRETQWCQIRRFGCEI